MNRFDIYVYTNEECKCNFETIPKIKIITAKRTNKIDLFFNILKYHIKYRFPAIKNIELIGCKAISWIPDFQQECLSDMFSAEEIDARRKERREIIENNLPLILSSNDSLNSFHKYYNFKKKNEYVMHFVSYIEPEICAMSAEAESITLKKYDLKGKKYVYIANQFWKHKNHIIVLEAINYLNNIFSTKLIFVFTGKMSDYRNPEYIEDLKKVFYPLEKEGIAINLGFVERMEQLIIMKNAEFLIQPSLFEGWGTVLEDAKVLDKTVLLSDIPVHMEQKNDKCILFDPNNAKNLANLIHNEELKYHFSDANAGVERMKVEAYKYSKEFQRLLQEDGGY